MDWEGQHPRGPSTPTSELSHSTSGTSSSRERIPPYKQLNPSPVISVLSKLSDDDLFRKGGDEILHMLRRVESDYKNLLSEHSGVVKDVNRRFQIFVLEARGLKEINQKLQDDNQELRDLCCFLDDDRQRSRKLAREWQRFGRYTASVMHSEVAAYQEKLKQLEDRQAELLSDNMELKELCLFLDHERSQMSGDRDDGDGSSNGTVPGQEDLQGQSQGDSDGQVTPTPTPTPSQQPSDSSPYVRQLELKIQRLEEEKKQLAQRVERNGADGYHPSDQNGGSRNVQQDVPSNQKVDGRPGATTPSRDRTTPTSSVNKPEAVVHAMKVLQVHEQLEREHNTKGSDDLETPQRAIVREMCNVVWRKLGDVGEYPPHTPASTPFSTIPQPHTAPATPMYRPQSATGNPIHSSSHTGPPPPLSKSLPSPLSLPTSPTTEGPSSYLDVHGNLHKVPPTSGGGGGAPGDAAGMGHPGMSELGQGPQGHWGERRGGHGLHAPRQSGGQAVSPGRREDHHHGGMGMMMVGQGGEGRDHMTRPGGGQGRENLGRANQGGGYVQPGPPAERPRQHPPPYSSSKSCPTLFPPSSGPGHSPSQHAPMSSPHPQAPPPHHQPPPSSRQQQQQAVPHAQRYQQRVHPFHANQHPPSSSPSSSSSPQGHHLPRSASGPATYYMSHPTAQSKTHPAATTMPSHHPPPPQASYMYPQRGGPGGGVAQPPFRSYPGGGDHGSRPGGEQGRTERRQTYLDD